MNFFGDFLPLTDSRIAQWKSGKEQYTQSFLRFTFLVLFSFLDQKGSGCRDQRCEKCSGVSRQRSVLKGKLQTQLMQVGDA